MPPPSRLPTIPSAGVSDGDIDEATLSVSSELADFFEVIQRDGFNKMPHTTRQIFFEIAGVLDALAATAVSIPLSYAFGRRVVNAIMLEVPVPELASSIISELNINPKYIRILIGALTAFISYLPLAGLFAEGTYSWARSFFQAHSSNYSKILKPRDGFDYVSIVCSAFLSFSVGAISAMVTIEFLSDAFPLNFVFAFADLIAVTLTMYDKFRDLSVSLQESIYHYLFFPHLSEELKIAWLKRREIRAKLNRVKESLKEFNDEISKQIRATLVDLEGSGNIYLGLMMLLMFDKKLINPGSVIAAFSPSNETSRYLELKKLLPVPSNNREKIVIYPSSENRWEYARMPPSLLCAIPGAFSAVVYISVGWSMFPLLRNIFCNRFGVEDNAPSFYSFCEHNNRGQENDINSIQGMIFLGEHLLGGLLGSVAAISFGFFAAISAYKGLGRMLKELFEGIGQLINNWRHRRGGYQELGGSVSTFEIIGILMATFLSTLVSLVSMSTRLELYLAKWGSNISTIIFTVFIIPGLLMPRILGLMKLGKFLLDLVKSKTENDQLIEIVERSADLLWRCSDKPFGKFYEELVKNGAADPITFFEGEAYYTPVLKEGEVLRC